MCKVSENVGYNKPMNITLIYIKCNINRKAEKQHKPSLCR